MKTCSNCLVIKELTEFPKDSQKIEGVRNPCKQCRNTRGRNKNIEPIDIDKKTCANCKVEKSIDNFYTSKRSPGGWERKCTSCRKNDTQKNYIKNKENIKIRTLEYYKNNKDSIRKTRRLYIAKKLKEDPKFKLRRNLRNRLYYALQKKSWKKNTHFAQYIGCSLEELKEYIEKQFSSDMNWNNHGILWDLDHRISLSNAQTLEQMYELCHYKNLQPLYSKINRNIKRANNDICWQKLQRDRLVEEDRKLEIPANIKVEEFIFSRETLCSEHKQFIERYEWLGTIGFGVRHVFTSRYKGLLGGVIMIAEPNGYQFDIQKEALIQRGASASWTPKNLGSALVSFSCRWMKQNTKKQIFVCYADTEAGEIGTIYQACNFKYLGNNFGAKEYFLVGDKKVGTRHFTRTGSMKKWAKELGIKWEDSWCKDNGFQNIKNIPEDIRKLLNNKAKLEMSKYPKIKAKPKHKYVLCLDKKLNKNIISLPYPKRA